LTQAEDLVPVSLEDKNAFLAMATQHFQELDPDFVPHADWTSSYLEGICANPDYRLLWILADGERAGFILFGIEKHRFLPRLTGNIFELYVSPAFRRRGLAARCAARAIAEMEERSPSKIQLEVVEGNEGAKALWSSLGFRKVTDRFVLAPTKPVRSSAGPK